MLHWEGWTYNNIIAWIEIISHIIGCVLIILVLFVFIWVFMCHCDILSSNETKSEDVGLSGSIPGSSGNRNISMSFSTKTIEPRSHEYYLKLILFGSIICGIITIYSNFWISNILILVFNFHTPYGCFYRALCIIPLYLQRLLTFSFFLYRLKLTFNGSIFALSTLLWYSLIITLFVTLIGSLSFIIIAAYISGLFRCSDFIVFGAFGVAGILDIGYSLTVCYIFVSKLSKLTKKCSCSNDIDNTRIKDVMKKLTILTLVSVSSSMILSLAIGIQCFGYQIQAFDIVINNACMMLSFGHLNSQYNKICQCCIKLEKYCCSTNKTKQIYSTETPTNHTKMSSDIINDPNSPPIP